MVGRNSEFCLSKQFNGEKYIRRNLNAYLLRSTHLQYYSILLYDLSSILMTKAFNHSLTAPAAIRGRSFNSSECSH